VDGNQHRRENQKIGTDDLDHGTSDEIERLSIENFDRGSGSIVERTLFNNRLIFLLFCLLLTIFLGDRALHVRVSAVYNQMIPIHQPFIVNYLNHYQELQAQANAVEIAVTANKGTILDKNYLQTLQHISDDVYLLPGVDRPFMTSLWTPNTRWVAITAVGMSNGPVIDTMTYDGSPASLATVRQNILATGKVGTLVSNDFQSSMIYMPLLEINNLTGKPLDYGELARELNALRTKYNSQGVTLHIVGFAMIVGDMINDIGEILAFFALSVVIAAAFLFWYTRCIRSTLLVVLASTVAVIWQMGLLTLLGFALTPYSVLVPFLIFAIGMSHGAQKMNGVMQDIGRGADPLVAARATFRRLFLAGLAALICDMTSFAVLLIIQIQAIQQLAIIASIGVGILVITNLLMVPVMLSFTGVSKTAALRSLERTPSPGQSRKSHPIWNFLDLFTQRRWATAAVIFMVVLGIAGWAIGRNVQVGDLDAGAPELRPHSQYNADNAFVVGHFSTGNDTFIVMADTPAQGCMDYDMLETMDRMQWRLQQLAVVKSTDSVASFASGAMMFLTEGSPEWYGLEPNQNLLNEIDAQVPAALSNFECSFAPVYLSLTDHKAKSLQTVVDTLQNFIAQPENKASDFKFSLAGGNAGIEAATNIAIKQANRIMLFLVYAVVIVFCFVTFRSWRAVVCAVVPLTITSILAQALMVVLGIGVKVATLPVIALGVGIGVDYALYVLSIMLKNLQAGSSLSEAYYRTLLFTGRVVILTGITLATGVATWIFAPIKFQADMGLLLSFMFVWNMFGAMILLPSLAYFLLPERLFRKGGDLSSSR
jgi:predicted RND superfamily exporter protein